MFSPAAPDSSQHKVINSDDKSQVKLTATSSVGDNEGSVYDCEEAADDDDPMNESKGRLGSDGQTSSGRLSQHKRYRTNLTNLQIHVMKYMFKDYKTPTMAECEILGSFIGLQKRVVQVWFQNARAKEKKHKLSSSTDDDALVPECTRCGVTYSSKCSIQEHIFSAHHVNQLRSTFNGKLTECDREAMRKQAEVRIRNPPPLAVSLRSDSLTFPLPLLLLPLIIIG